MSPKATLRNAIRRLHGCDSRHVESVRVTETFQGKTVWGGTVEVFDLMGHPTARRAYAWAHETDQGKTRYVAVLHEGPVDSAVNAVRAAIVQERKSAVVFVGSSRRHVYHKPECDWAIWSAADEVMFRSWQDAEAQGFRPCRTCKPLG